MSLQIKERRAGNAIILDCNGDLTLGEGCTRFRQCVEALVDEELAASPRRDPKLVVGLAEICYIDSYGMGALVISLTRITNAGGTMKLLNHSKHVQTYLDLTKLDTVFEIFDSEVGAVQSCT